MSVKRFVRAYSEAIYQFKNNKEKALAVYAARLKQQNPAVLEALTNTMLRCFLFRRARFVKGFAMPLKW